MLAMWIENPILSYNEILDFGAPFNGSRLCKNSSFGQNGPVRYALILTSSLRLLVIGLNLEIQTFWLEFLHSLDPLRSFTIAASLAHFSKSGHRSATFYAASR